MRVNEFRFMSRSDAYYPQVMNWSRRYEWLWAINKMQEQPSLVTIHNTTCGHTEIHKQFADMLDTFCKWNNKVVCNSDLIEQNLNSNFTKFFVYDVTKEHPEKYDVVLCISAIEELAPAGQIAALNNLYQQVNKGGRLLITSDYPTVDLAQLEEHVKHKCLRVHEHLTGSTSTHPQLEFTDLSPIVLDITRT